MFYIGVFTLFSISREEKKKSVHILTPASGQKYFKKNSPSHGVTRALPGTRVPVTDILGTCDPFLPADDPTGSGLDDGEISASRTFHVRDEGTKSRSVDDNKTV